MLSPLLPGRHHASPRDAAAAKIGVVGPVGVVVGAGLRRRWGALLVLTLALGLVGAIVLASIAGSRRGREALDEFLDFHRPGNVEAYVDPSLPIDEQVDLMDGMLRAAEPAPSIAISQVIVAMPGPDGVRSDGTDFAVAEAYFRGEPLDELRRTLIIDGELPLDPGEVAISEKVRDRRGVDVGDVLPVALFPADSVDQVGNGNAVEPQEVVDATVGAIIREPLDLARSPQAQPGTIFETDEAHLVFEPTFFEEHARDSAAYGLGAALDLPEDRLDRVTEAMSASGGDAVLVNPTGSEDLVKLGPVDDAIQLEANALLAFAAVVLAFGLLLLGAALHRSTQEEPEDRPTLLTLGLTPRQLGAATLLRGSVVALGATLLAVVGAVLASAAFPVGLAADAEIRPGIEVDAAVLAIGAPAFGLLVMGRLLVGVLARERTATRAAPAVPGLPLTPGALGVRLATDGLGGGGRATTRIALVTVVVGVAAVVGAVTFADSLDRLTGSPERQGWTWDVAVGNYATNEAGEEGRATLEANDDVERFAGYQSSTLMVDGEQVPLAEFDAEATDLVPIVLDGRAPQGDDEVAFGRGTLEQLGKEVGDTVTIQATAEPVEATIVGEIVAPAVVVTAMDLDSGGSITFELAARVFADQPGATQVTAYLVDLRDDVDREAALDRLREDFPGTVLGPMKPLDVTDLGRVRGLPYLLAGLLGLIALVTVVLTLAAASRRRRRDVALLRALGFARGQLRRLLAGEATTFLVLSLVVGIPVGIVVGRLAWTLAADGLGSEAGPVLPLATIVVATAGLLLLVNAYGQWLAHLAGRRHPGRDLRNE